MKKLILLLVAVFSLSLVTTSCKESKKDSDKTEMHEDHEKHEEHAEEAHEEGANHKDELAYACPMDCEDGKTYADKGICPECEMDLKPKGEHKEMKHAEGCKCAEDGECNCEDGKCKCQTETATAKMDCTKCEPGACECKA